MQTEENWNAVFSSRDLICLSDAEFSGLNKITVVLSFRPGSSLFSETEACHRVLFLLLWFWVCSWCYNTVYTGSLAVSLSLCADFDSFMSVGEMIVSNTRRKSVSDIIDHHLIPWTCVVLLMTPSRSLSFGLTMFLTPFYSSLWLVFIAGCCSLTGSE